MCRLYGGAIINAPVIVNNHVSEINQGTISIVLGGCFYTAGHVVGNPGHPVFDVSEQRLVGTVVQNWFTGHHGNMLGIDLAKVSIQKDNVQHEHIEEGKIRWGNERELSVENVTKIPAIGTVVYCVGRKEIRKCSIIEFHGVYNIQQNNGNVMVANNIGVIEVEAGGRFSEGDSGGPIFHGRNLIGALIGREGQPGNNRFLFTPLAGNLL
jgi:hypothetical protein